MTYKFLSENAMFESRRTLCSFIFGIAGAAVLWTSVLAQSPTAQQVVDNVKARFSETGVFSARFEQTIDNSFDESGQRTVLSGTIIAGRSGYRVEMADQIVVTDEKTTWVYLIDDQQVIINDYLSEEGSFSPNQFIGDKAEEFEAEFADEADATRFVVLLSPASPESYIATATLWVRKSDYVVTRIDVVDVNGARIRFEMSDVDFHPQVNEDTFQFSVPEGVEIIDLRA
ncbi:MAG TPA: outer membrane lipoprotein carrier protein LolA [Rhodothermales bacterium]|nr:outer membrane lipoprotein carrier protein LolA [Rhodothermales bacterium]